MSIEIDEQAMTLEVLHVPDCPNVDLMLDRLMEVTDVPATVREVTTDSEAAAWGMAGSPTLLVNGVDPFASDGACECGISCRLYRDENDRIARAPSVEQLRSALAGAGRVEGLERCALPLGVTSGDSPVAGLSSWRAGAAPESPLERAVHRAILRSFAERGAPPSLEEVCETVGDTVDAVRAALVRLHRIDAIRLDSQGGIAVAYPFSSTPTRHRVRVADRVEVYAMCGIDALGIPAMVGEDVRIHTVDPGTGDPIVISSDDGQFSWNPASAVAFVGAGAGAGPSADCCCDLLNLFSSTASADAWLAARPTISGQVLTRPEAEELAKSLFGALLV